MKLVRSMTVATLALLAIGARASIDLADSERVIDAGAGELVTATVNGHPMKLRPDFDAIYSITLNASSAARAGLKPATKDIGHWRGTGWQLGSDRPRSGPIFRCCSSYDIKGDRGAADLEIGGLKRVQDINWASASRGAGPGVWLEPKVIDGDADGIVHPKLLPENRVTLRLRPPAAGERTIELPVGTLRGQAGLTHALSHPLRLGDEILHVSFAPHQPFSLASGGAAAYLAAAQAGDWAGDKRPARVLFGFERSVRPMVLERPVDLHGLPIHGFMVLTADWRGGRQLPSDEKAAPDEILVRGKAKTSRAYLALSLGQDALAHCSSITHDKMRKMVTLRCR